MEAGKEHCNFTRHF